MKLAGHIDISLILLLFSAGFAVFGSFGVILFLLTSRSPKKDTAGPEALAKAQALEAKLKRAEEILANLEKNFREKGDESAGIKKSIEVLEPKLTGDITALKSYLEEKLGEIASLKSQSRELEEKLTSKILLLKQDPGQKSLEALKDLEAKLTAKIDALSVAVEPVVSAVPPTPMPKPPAPEIPKAETPPAAETPKPAEVAKAPEAPPPAAPATTPENQEAKEILALMQKKKE